MRGTFALFFGASTVVWLILELRQGLTRRPEAVNADRGSLVALRVAFIGGAAATIVAMRIVPAAAIHPESLAAWLGLTFLWAGIAMRLWSFEALGRYFT